MREPRDNLCGPNSFPVHALQAGNVIRQHTFVSNYLQVKVWLWRWSGVQNVWHLHQRHEFTSSLRYQVSVVTVVFTLTLPQL